MRKPGARVAMVALVVLLSMTRTTAQQPLFIWGIVTWESGTPAVGLEVRLVRGGGVRARTYTNQGGRYGFFGVEGQPVQYRVQVVSGKQILAERGLQDISLGERVPDIAVR